MKLNMNWKNLSNTLPLENYSKYEDNLWHKNTSLYLIMLLVTSEEFYWDSWVKTGMDILLQENVKY